MMCLRLKFKNRIPTVAQVSQMTGIDVANVVQAVKYSRRIENGGRMGQKYFNPQIAQELEYRKISPIERRNSKRRLRF